MRYLIWVVKLALFLFVLTFAVKNTETVTVRYYLGNEWQAPLIFVVLAFFCIGAGAGVVACLGKLFRQRRDIIALKREVRALGEQRSAAADVPTPPPA